MNEVIPNDEKCVQCGEPYESQDIEGGRCTKCGVMIASETAPNTAEDC